jgi:hypothetical protein
VAIYYDDGRLPSQTNFTISWWNIYLAFSVWVCKPREPADNLLRSRTGLYVRFVTLNYTAVIPVPCLRNKKQLELPLVYNRWIVS